VPAAPPAVIEERPVRVPAPEPPRLREQPPLVPPAAPAEEVVRISIGRIEVRTTPPAAPRAAPAPLARPRQSLDDYLDARDRGRR
jgi:hypothetical protein